MPVLVPPQATVRVEVDFYDESERDKLLKYPTAIEIAKLTSSPIDVPIAEFLTYYLFHRKRLGQPGYRDYSAIGRKLEIALASMDGCIDFNGQSICMPPGAANQLTEISEHVGEATGLCLISRIHELTEADWAPIEARGGRGAAPSFDFQLASDGKQFVQVETKGSSVADNTKRDGAVAAQKKRIAEKKNKLDERAASGTDPNPADLRYGTIAVADARRDGNLRCWLTDPTPEQTGEEPRRFRLLQRMRFLRDWITFISPRSQLTSALATRVTDLETITEPFELDGVALRRGYGDPFDDFPAFWSKSRIKDGPAGGVVVKLSDSALFFLGVRDELVTTAVSQHFTAIEEYASDTGTVSKTVECVLSTGRFRSMQLEESILAQPATGEGYVRFELNGQIHYSRGGLVFGILPLREG